MISYITILYDRIKLYDNMDGSLMSNKLYASQLHNTDRRLLAAEWATTRRQCGGLLKSPVVAAPPAVIAFQFSDCNSLVGNPSSNWSPLPLKGTLLPTDDKDEAD